MLVSTGINRLIEFEPQEGTIVAEAGITLDEILHLITNKGWFLPVVPGTRYITLGGAVANDIHGKNHHQVGSFGNYVKRFGLLRSNGENLTCSEDLNKDLFHATIGGLGLTGVITWVEISLSPIKSKFIEISTERFEHIQDYWIVNKELEKDWEYTVAWIDCLSNEKKLGRGVFLSGQHTEETTSHINYKDRKITFPFEPPFSFVNNLSGKLVNTLYYRINSSKKSSIKHYQPFMFPLDAVNKWNRVYGRKGFFQYQCVFPSEVSEYGVKEVLKIIRKGNQKSYLGVVKNFGNIESKGILSFARPGTTLALDFRNKGQETLNLFQQLDSVVAQLKGALYPAKDARMSGEMFRASFPRYEEFLKFVDPKFSSSFWERVSR
tara:strand:+ start:5 stop:1141 length:1137 start_codon:yes stop_codon:yes gene_type:complete